MSPDAYAMPAPIPASGVPPEVAAACLLSVEEWTRTLLDLLPRGVVWPREPGTIQEAFFLAIADAMVAVQTRDCDLLAESYPCGAEELLADWERVLGLPDECTGAQDWPLEARQAFVCAKLAAQGGQSRSYFIELAAAYGFTISITEHEPWRMGCRDFCECYMGEPVCWWTVECASLPVTHATVGCWYLGEPICTVHGADVLECIIRRAAPANTIVTFAYTLVKAGWNTGRWNFDAWSEA
jgi:uncharacterized protein YmfQ (DUF2313 family)